MQVYNNSPQIGYIEWEDLNIAYQGVNYAIDDGFTQNLFVWWDPGISTTSLQAGNALPDPFPDDGVVVFLNKNGTHVLVPGASVVQGSLIVQESILANALAANSVTSDKILAGAILSEKIGAGEVQAINLAAGSVTTSKIEAGAITSNEIAANAVTANEIAAGAVTATQLATDAIQSLNYSPPNGSSEPFSQQGSFFKLDDGDIITPGLVVDGGSGDVAVRGDVTATSLTVRNTVDDSEPMLIANSDDPQAEDTRNRLLLRTSFSDANDGTLEWGSSPIITASGSVTRTRLQAPVRNHLAVTDLDPAHVALDGRSNFSGARMNAGSSSGNTHFSEVSVTNISTGGNDAAYATMHVGYGTTANQARVHLSAFSYGAFMDLDADTINVNGHVPGHMEFIDHVNLPTGTNGVGPYCQIPPELRGKYRGYRLVFRGGINGDQTRNILLFNINSTQDWRYRFSSVLWGTNYMPDTAHHGSDLHYPFVGYCSQFLGNLCIVDLACAPGLNVDQEVSWVSQGYHNHASIPTKCESVGRFRTEGDTIEEIGVRTVFAANGWTAGSTVTLWGIS